MSDDEPYTVSIAGSDYEDHPWWKRFVQENGIYDEIEEYARNYDCNEDTAIDAVLNQHLKPWNGKNITESELDLEFKSKKYFNLFLLRWM